MSQLVTPALVLDRRNPAAQRERLGWCLLVVVAAHAMLVAATLRQPMPANAESGPVRAVQVRLVPTTTDVPRTTPRHTAQITGDRGDTSRLNRDRPAVATISDAGPDGATSAVAEADASYVPRSSLTTAPKPKGPVAIDYPYFDGEADFYTGEFDLFIDDTGGVLRVVSATPDLPGVLSYAVREAFLAARFSPGEVSGLPVRSRLRIEVTFDSRRPPSS